MLSLRTHCTGIKMSEKRHKGNRRQDKWDVHNHYDDLLEEELKDDWVIDDNIGVE